MTLPSFPRLFSIAGACLALLAPLSATGGTALDESARVLKTGVDEVLDTITRTPESADIVAALRPVLGKYFQFEVTTRLAVGPSWRQFTPDQRAQTTELFTDLLIRTYAQRLTGDSRPSISYGSGTELGTGKVEIPTTVNYQGASYAVVYRLSQVGTSWRVYDVIIEGVSMVANYRGQFTTLFNKGGAKNVIDSLKAKVAQAPSAS